MNIFPLATALLCARARCDCATPLDVDATCDAVASGQRLVHLEWTVATGAEGLYTTREAAERLLLGALRAGTTPSGEYAPVPPRLLDTTDTLEMLP